ncbi:hypothetical protein AGMMS50268_02810 [Spirochaetia bacterium]|nr:hypothetical protein AGMMS50268_02810 [Spirochaetia bacterium]
MIRKTQLGSLKLERLRKKVNSNDYLYEGIQRIALILSNELLDISQGGLYHERQRKGRK